MRARSGRKPRWRGRQGGGDGGGRVTERTNLRSVDGRCTAAVLPRVRVVVDWIRFDFCRCRPAGRVLSSLSLPIATSPLPHWTVRSPIARRCEDIIQFSGRSVTWFCRRSASLYVTHSSEQWCGYSCDLTSIRRPFDGLSKSLMSQRRNTSATADPRAAVTLTYLFI